MDLVNESEYGSSLMHPEIEGIKQANENKSCFRRCLSSRITRIVFAILGFIVLFLVTYLLIAVGRGCRVVMSLSYPTVETQKYSNSIPEFD